MVKELKKYIKKSLIKYSLFGYREPFISFIEMSLINNIGQVIFENGKGYIKLKDGIIFRYDPNYKISQLYSIPQIGEFEKKETDFVKKLIKPGDTCFDIGGSFGWYTILLSKLIGRNGEVHSFEPISINYEMLNENVKKNLCNNVILNQIALDESSGERELYVSDIGVSGSFELHKHDRSYETSLCRTITLDQYCKEHEVSNIDFLKADIEGAELLMIKGGSSTIESTMPIMLVEIQESSTKLFGYKPFDIFNYIYKFGYNSYYINNDIELEKFEFQNNTKLPDYNFIFWPVNKPFTNEIIKKN